MSSKQRIEASTKVYLDECIYTWTIENYHLLKFKVGQILESPNFGVGSDNKQYFKLFLYTEGQKEEHAGYISLFLKPVIDSTKKPNKLVCRWSLSAINDKKVVQQSTWHNDFANNQTFPGMGWPTFFKVENIDQLISAENTVTIQCELEVFKEFKSSLNYPDIIDGKNQTIDKVNLDSLFLSEEFSDIRIITSDGNDIPAHKAILAAASPVFRAMFIHDKLEKEENSVKITDTTKNTVIEMLRFIYNGQIDATKTDMIIELLAVADKYQMDTMKNKCGKMLCSVLSSENAINILIAAHKYKAKYLEDETIKFITTQTQLLSNSKKMKEIDDPDIWVNLTQSIIKSQKKTS